VSGGRVAAAADSSPRDVTGRDGAGGRIGMRGLVPFT
jgi:hypothetical protein